MRDVPQWLSHLLGSCAEDATRLIPDAVRAAHQRARNTQDASGLRQLNPYGNTFWLVVCEELILALGGLPGARLFRPKGASYELVVLNGTAICPCRVKRTTGRLEDARLKPTRVRRALSSLHQRTESSSMFDLTAIGYDEAELFDPAQVIPIGSASRVLFAPFDVDARVGLTAVGVGQGLVLADGTVEWSEFHQLALDLHRAGPQAISDLDEPRFDNGSIPEPPIKRRAQPVKNPEAHDADSDTTGRSIENGTDE